MIDRIREMLPGNAGWFDIIEVSGNSTPVSYRDNRLHSITERQNSGFGVRVNLNGRTGFSYSNDAGRIDETARRAVDMAAYGDNEDFELPGGADALFEPYSESIHDFDITREIDKAEAAIGAILRQFPDANMDCTLRKSTGSTRIVNSKGIDVSYKNSAYSASLSASLILDDGTRIDIGEGLSALAPVSYDALYKKIANKLENATHTRKLKSGKVPVILSPKAFARIIGIVTAGLSAKSVSKGISPFSDKIGTRLFSSRLTLSDDPALESSPYSRPFDDEGVTARKKVLINCGRIEKFISDLKYAHKLGLEPEGNGTRGYSSLPYPSFNNVIIEGGGVGFSEMLKSIKRGILADQFIGLGQSNTLTGDFSAGLDLAYLVENGEITGRIKDCMLSDNLFSLLNSDILLSSDRERSGSVLAPYALFPQVNYTG